MKYLVIAEKPMLAKLIIKNLPTNTIDSYMVTALCGHILEYVSSKEQDDKWIKWNLESLPVYDMNWKIKCKSTTTKILKEVQSKLSQCDAVINAGDMDAEGQRLVDEVLEYLHNTKPVYRLNTADTTDKSLSNAILNIKDNKQYIGLSNSAKARALSDMFYGYTASRLFTVSTGKKINIGRVASNVISLVATRDQDIANFSSNAYSTITCTVTLNNQSCIATVYIPSDSKYLDKYGYLSNPTNIQYIKDLVDNKQYNGSVVESKVTITPPLPFSLLTLQKELQKYNILADETMSITQSLRDKYNAITYNRTEHNELPISYYDNRKSHIDQVLSNLNNPKNFIEQSNYKSKCFIDSSEVQEHFGIIPQEVPITLSKLTDKEQLVYTVIANRYLQQFMGDRIDTRKTLTINLPDNLVVKATSSITTTLGWYLLDDHKIDDTEDNQDNNFQDIPFSTTSNSQFILSNPNEKKSKTKPPVRYSMASLLAQLKKDDLGTPATRDGIVKHQIDNGYLELHGKFIESTDLGKQYISVVPSELRSPDITANWATIRSNIESNTSTIEDLTKYSISVLDKYIANPNLIPKIPLNEYYETDNGYYYKITKDNVHSLSKNKGLFTKLTSKQAQILLTTNKLSKATLVNKSGSKFTAVNITVTFADNDDRIFKYPSVRFELDTNKNDTK
jgi:DNA topoisomerase III